MKTKLFYLQDRNGHINSCVVSKLLDEPLNGVPTVVFSIATHNPLDRFEKRRGRDIATARLDGGKYAGFVPAEKGVKRTILSRLIASKATPQRTREAAALWLEKHPEPPVDDHIG